MQRLWSSPDWRSYRSPWHLPSSSIKTARKTQAARHKFPPLPRQVSNISTAFSGRRTADARPFLTGTTWGWSATARESISDKVGSSRAPTLVAIPFKCPTKAITSPSTGPGVFSKAPRAKKATSRFSRSIPEGNPRASRVSRTFRSIPAAPFPARRS